MFSNDYFSDTRKFTNSSMLAKGQAKEEPNYFGDDYRGKTSTSSQRTLRYNDFELIQK